MAPQADDLDPRLGAEDPPIAPAEQMRPAVAGGVRPTHTWLVAGGAVLLGLVVFFWLSANRVHRVADDPLAQTTTTSAPISAPISAPTAPPDVVALETSSRGVAIPGPASVIPTPVVSASPPAVASIVPSSSLSTAAALDAAQRLKAPALVVDLGDGPAAAPAAGATTTGGAHSNAAGGPATPSALSGDEQFAERVGAEEPEHARATALHNLQAVIPQGAMIPGVLETAMNSDLPGFVRAVVSRDVRSFDGSQVLIPSGSRVIGQYKSGVALGQSRAFVIWTRVLRPDGVSIQIGSSGADPLGRAGLEGSVDRHFFQRFGGAVLLSVVNAGISSLVDRPNTEIVIGSTQEATNAVSTLVQPSVIPPTIKVPQGTPIRIFVARDLDFSTVQGPGR